MDCGVELSDPSYAIQIAEAAALLADDDLTALVGTAVYDDLSAPASAYPRVCIGQHQVLGNKNSCFDPAEVYSTIHIWTQGADGRLTAKNIGAAVSRILSTPLTLTGHRMDSTVFESANYMADEDVTQPDSRVCHGVVTMLYRTVPAT